jgi:type IV pilus assembly protein PilW
VRQRGLTLIELMVGLVLGLFVLAGLLALFVGNKQTYRAQDAAADLQANARFALEILNREARKAGYRAAFVTPAQAFPAVTGFAAGQVVAGTDSPSPRLSLRYQGSGTGTGDGWMRDCLGANLAGGALATVALSVGGQDLQCSVNGGAAQPLLGGVQALRFTYGVDTSNPPDFYADSYVAAASVPDWSRVASVRIELLLVTAEDGLTDAPQPYLWSDATVTPTDKKMRRAYSNVISFRNLLP